MPTGWSREGSSQTEKYEKNQEKSSSKSVESRTEQESPELPKIERFEPEKPRRALNDLVVSSTVPARIETALSLIRFHHELYNEWNLKKIDPYGAGTAINLFGPSGTGKTFCAEAIAHYLEKTIIDVSYAELESKYVGETPKNVVAAFEKAHETDSVLFFDEADSVLGKRVTNITQSADSSINQSRAVMLKQLDKFSGVVIFATNFPRNYDGAFVRRILAHIEFELPDEECRFRLWQYLLPAEVPGAKALP